MYKIEWDKETGGVILSTNVTKETLGISPRPVFYEELNLLGLNKLGWIYPECEEPLMWAVNKQYFYRGEQVFSVKGANIYTMPTVEFCLGVMPMDLQPVDVETMLDRTEDLMFALENEAIDFIRDTFIAYTRANKAYTEVDTNRLDYEKLAADAEKKSKKKMAIVKQSCDSFDIMPLDVAKEEGKRQLLTTKIDKFIASFSGGKDSQVVLDLCTRAIPPDDFEVIYSDTGYELPSSLALYDEVKAYYNEKFPSLKFHLVRNHESVLNYWDKIGTPSDSHRWCCSIMKTVPIYRYLRKKSGSKSKFLAFEGVRKEESPIRNDYNRIGKGVKHSFVINARPILRWNTIEVFLYLFRHILPINKAYRIGKPRVGCVLCPFGSPWDDMIVNNCFTNELSPFLKHLESIVKERNIPNNIEYIADRKWKIRGSGKYDNNNTKITIRTSPMEWEASVEYAQKSIFDWLIAIGQYSVRHYEYHSEGELRFGQNVYEFKINYGKTKNDFCFTIRDNNNVSLRLLLRRLINKVAYCINCEACELECDIGALSVYPNITIEKILCKHCHKCLWYHDTGCIVADSLQKPSETNLSNMKISKYGTFGIHQEWVDQFLSDSDSFWANNQLGVKQVPSFKAWLKDAEIIDEKGVITPFGELCKKLNYNSQTILWEIIYINLVYNNALLKWYTTTITFEKDILRKDLDDLAVEHFQSQFKKTTITYAIQALMQTFKYSPIGELLGQCVVQDEKGLVIRRCMYNDLSPKSIAYSIYKYGKSKQLNLFRVSDLYQDSEDTGVFREFGLNKEYLLKALRFFTSKNNRVLVAELNMGLEHISLQDDLNPIDILKIANI